MLKHKLRKWKQSDLAPTFECINQSARHKKQHNYEARDEPILDFNSKFQIELFFFYY